MKKIDEKKLKRIAFYHRKVSELLAVKPPLRDEKWDIRYKRLIKYKKQMNEWLKEVK